MCRWLAYSGESIYLEDLIFRTEHSLIDQSLSAQQGASTTNGDGVGIGWYDQRDTPGLYRDTHPAWNDRNLGHLTHHIRSPLFLAHVRAATGSAVQRTNCHPFAHENWLFMHNGVIREFNRVKRELALAVAPELYGEIEGTTDTELMFYLALTFGLRDEPIAGLERMAGFVDAVGRKHGVPNPLQMTLGVCDGGTLYAVRYSSERCSRRIYHTRSPAALAEVNPEISRFGERAVAIVSEPFNEMSDQWIPIGESTAVLVRDGEVELRPFTPQQP